MAKRPPSLKTPAFALKGFAGVALHRRLFLTLREQILSGDIRKGERLPSSRALAKTLLVSRNTVLNAYDRLAEESYIVAKVGSGTHVAVNFPRGPNANLLHLALVPYAVTSRVNETKRGFDFATILQRSYYPLRRAAFQDRDGNALYLYDSHLWS